MLLAREDVPDGGWFVGPTIVAVDDPAAPVATEEIFGPVLAVLRARDFDHAIELANGTDYALTAGCFSRSPVHLRRAAAELRAGNVYLNRHITGAVVGRQPFGGLRHERHRLQGRRPRLPPPVPRPPRSAPRTPSARASPPSSPSSAVGRRQSAAVATASPVCTRQRAA